MCTYLDQVGHTYYFRRVVPVELRAFIRTATGAPRSEWKFSLQTKDRDTAKRLIPCHTIDTDRQLDHARIRAAEAPETRASDSGNKSPWQSEAAAESSKEAARDDAEREARWAARAPLRERLERAFRKSTAEITREEAAMRDILRDRTYVFTVAEEHRIMARLLRAEERRGGPPLEAPTMASAAPQASSASNKPGSSPAMLDTTIIDLWAAERKPVLKGKDTHRSVAEWFYKRAGSKPVAEISRQDVLRFKAALVEEGQTPANIKMKLSRLRTLLQWAADNDYATTNAASGITIKVTDAAKNKRKEFDLASLNAIFASPVFAGGARPAGGKGEAAYWLPLLALFTGARLEELGQLRPSDIQQITYPDSDGVDQQSWFIRIKEDQTDNLRLKNADSERDVPIHPELERLGFLTFVMAAIDAKHERLFPKLTANIYGRLTAKWGEWFSPYLRTVCGVTDKRMVFHSFRHTFKQYARHVGMIDGVQRQIMGHSASDVADDYGSGYPQHRVVDGMRQFKVPGLVLPVAKA